MVPPIRSKKEVTIKAVERWKCKLSLIGGGEKKGDILSTEN